MSKKTHDIPEQITNSAVNHCIDEYVRLDRDRQILRDHWFGGLSFKALADKYDVTLNTIKRVIYGQGDKVILRAAGELKKES